ncbi:MAG TPA: triose-phosphate isomerase [Candidatus Binataceae bacterium]|jgi:triosephosphate isomerase
MRRKMLAGNWKMNLTPTEARKLIRALRAELDPEAATLARDRDVLVAPAAIALAAAAQELAGSSIALAAQNMHYEDKGAFTGEVSAPMLKAAGVTHVILGHSERRHVFGESDELINRKVQAAVKHRLVPILCVGETQEEHDGGHTTTVVLRQTQNGLAGLDGLAAGSAIIAYEPVWAIGTGRTATPAQASLAHGVIREAIRDNFGPECAAAIRILYGGSVTPENVDGIVSSHDIDGALVGGASLKADSFARIVRARVS